MRFQFARESSCKKDWTKCREQTLLMPRSAFSPLFAAFAAPYILSNPSIMSKSPNDNLRMAAKTPGMGGVVLVHPAYLPFNA
jgi:hypothetical protein